MERYKYIRVNAGFYRIEDTHSDLINGNHLLVGVAYDMNLAELIVDALNFAD